MKSVLITGTSRGIGLETALTFGRAGYKVFATMRKPENANNFKETIEKESLPISVSAMDVNSDDSVTERVEAIIRENGPIDILVNNAGIESYGSVEEMDIATIRLVMETNYFGAIRCMKAIIPQMRDRREGCIINIASVAGHISSSPLGAYAASKFALEAISEALAQELKPFNVMVKVVEPGIIDTRMARNITQGTDSMYAQSRRFGGLFAASLKTPTQPSLVANKILEVAQNGSWKLRHPVGPDAEPFLQWRSGMSDEEWIDWNAAGDEDWYNAIERDFGLNARME